VTIEAGPGDLGSFVVGSVASQVAGGSFQVTATAYDTCGEIKTDFTGPASIGATAPYNGDAPNGSAPAEYGTQPGNGLSWASGVGTASVTVYRAGTASVTVGDGTISDDSGSFTVAPATLASIAFAQQPTRTQVATAISPAVTVSGVDLYGNGASGSVGVVIGANPGNATAVTASASLVGGVATFASLVIDRIGLGYTLVASSDLLLSDTSDPFDVVTTKCVDDTTSCVAETPPGGNTSSRVEVGDSSTTNGEGTLYLDLDPTAVVTCGGSFQIGTTVVLQPTGFDTQSRAVMRIQYDKSQAPGIGVSNYVFCFDKGDDGPDDDFVPAKCPKKITAATPWCEMFRKRTDAGDLLVQFNGPVQDPRISGFG
jgi:hypothetical protein